jgi:Ca2+-binding EF-hand superfamily protein
MMRRALCALIALWLCLPFFALAEENVDVPPIVGTDRINRALLVGCDRFLSQPDTTPSSSNNVLRMAEAFSGSTMDFDVLMSLPEGLSSTGDLAAAILDAFSRADDNDVSYFYLSTHGVWEEGMTAAQMTLLLSDGQRETAVSAYMLRTMFDQIAGKKVLIIDACHSGKIQKEEFETYNTRIVAEGSIVFRGNGAIMKLSENAKNINNAINSLFTDFTKGNGATILSSSNGMEVAIEDQNVGNGLFTWAIKQGISGKKADTDKDGIINIQELANYINQKVTNLSSGVQTPGLRVENKYINFNLFQ